MSDKEVKKKNNKKKEVDQLISLFFLPCESKRILQTLYPSHLVASYVVLKKSVVQVLGFELF